MIVPTTFKPGDATEFLLRIFTDHSANVHEMNKDKPDPPWYSSACGLGKQPVLLTRVLVRGAVGLEKNDTFGSKVFESCLLFLLHYV